MFMDHCFMFMQQLDNQHTGLRYNSTQGLLSRHEFKGCLNSAINLSVSVIPSTMLTDVSGLESTVKLLGSKTISQIRLFSHPGQKKLLQKLEFAHFVGGHLSFNIRLVGSVGDGYNQQAAGTCSASFTGGSPDRCWDTSSHSAGKGLRKQVSPRKLGNSVW